MKVTMFPVLCSTIARALLMEPLRHVARRQFGAVFFRRITVHSARYPPYRLLI